MKTHVTIERGVAFFEDGSEVSNVSVELFKASPDLLAACQAIVFAVDECALPIRNESTAAAVRHARAAMTKAGGAQ